MTKRETRLVAELEALFDNDVIGMARGDRGVIREANDEFLRMCGRTRGELESGLGWEAIAGPENLEVFAGAMSELTRTGRATLTGVLHRPDGRHAPTIATAVMLPGTQWWIAAFVDLSEEVRVDRTLYQELAVVATLLDDAPIGFALIDRDVRFVRVNRELAAMNGVAQGEHIGRDVFDIVPGLRATAEPLLTQVMRSGEPIQDIELTGATAADPGVEHTWLESFFPVRTATGVVLGVAAIARDETRVRRLQAELTNALDQANHALLRVQRSLLQDNLPEVEGVTVAVQYLPASDEVRLGGDWYDVVPAPDGHLVLSVGDCLGHGLDALGVMAQATAALRAFVAEGYGPARILSRLNSLLCQSDVAGLASAVVASLDPASGRLRYASAGHPYAALCSPDWQPEWLDDAQGPLLGLSPTSKYTGRQRRLGVGTTLIMYTDGLVERHDESLAVGLERLRRILCLVPRGADAAATVDTLIEGCVGEGRTDDICVLAAQRSKARGTSRVLDVGSFYDRIPLMRSRHGSSGRH